MEVPIAVSLKLMYRLRKNQEMAYASKYILNYILVLIIRFLSPCLVKFSIQHL